LERGYVIYISVVADDPQDWFSLHCVSFAGSEYAGGKMEVGGTVSYNLIHQTGDCNLGG